MKCPECQSTNASHSYAVPGLMTCPHCGKVSPATEPVPVATADTPEASAPEGGEQLASGLDPAVQVPDAVGVCYGWRSWKVMHQGLTPLLHAVTKSAHHWTPGAPMVATCELHGDDPDHEVPEETCGCGLYSAKSLEHLYTMSYHEYGGGPDRPTGGARDTGFTVVGRVSLWGKVIEGTQGWRAEAGYPDTLYLPYEAWRLREPLQRFYRVPVYLKNILADPAESEVWE